MSAREENPMLRTFPVVIDPSGYWPAQARNEVRRAMLLRYEGQIWSRRGEVVRLDPETGRIEPLSLTRFRALAPEAVIYREKKAGKERHIEVPKRVLDEVYAGPHWPELAAVRRAPWVTETGRLVVEPGYDEETGIYLHWLDDPCDPDAVTQSDVTEVLDRLTDFSFSGPADKVALVALFLQTVRNMQGMPSPLGLITALDAESAKSLIAKLIGCVALGVRPPTTILPERTVELGYTLGAHVRSEPPILWIDNVATGSTLGGPDLHAILTASSDVSSRIIGSGAIGSGDPTRIQWIATGNQIGVDLELARRVLAVQLRIRPANRPFLTADLVRWVLENRRLVLSVLLRLHLDWHRAGCPAPPRSLPSFEGWSQLVGGPICLDAKSAALWLSEASRPVPARDSALAELCSSWPTDRDGRTKPLSASMVLSLAESLSLLPIVATAGDGSERSRQTRFGTMLAVLARQERPVLGWRLKSQRSSNGPVYLPLRSVGGTGPPPDGRDPSCHGPPDIPQVYTGQKGPTGPAGPGPDSPHAQPSSPPQGARTPMSAVGPAGPVGPVPPPPPYTFTEGRRVGGLGEVPGPARDPDRVRIDAKDPAYSAIVEMASRGIRVDPERWLQRAEEAELALSASGSREDQDRLKNLRSYKHPVYLQALAGRVRCDWELQGPGRIGTVRPALHQITKKHGMRTPVHPEDGRVLVVGDWRAAHVWIAAGASRDGKMLEALSEGHLYERAAEVWKTIPETAKVCVLATLNGAGPGRLVEILDEDTEERTGEAEAKRRRETWLGGYPAARATLRGWHGRRTWRSPLGRLVSMPDDRADYSAVGWSLQAIEADALRLVLMRLQWPVVLTVHDEVILEVAEADAVRAAADLRTAMDESLREVADLRDMQGDTVRVEVRRAWRES